ncbi:hypothetical protein KJ903_00905 [Patescibacteria group bacterium]|nr:hypothetical protein [Patescibacteria group bacterium]
MVKNGLQPQVVILLDLGYNKLVLGKKKYTQMDTESPDTKTETPDQEIPTKPQKKHRRGLKIAIGVVLAVAAIGGGMLLAYFDVFNSGADKETVGGMTMEEFFAQEGDTSFDLIDKAYEEGKIDKETSLIYGAYAAFGDERLPEEYQSDIIAFEANHVFREIRENYDSFSPENKEIIDPFLKRPDDPESWWNEKVREKQVRNNPDLIKAARAKDREVKSIFSEHLTTVDGKIKIWYAQIGIFDDFIDKIFKPGRAEYFDAADKEMAEKIKDILDKDRAYAKFSNIMAKEPLNDGNLGGDGELDIYAISPTMMEYKRLQLTATAGYSGVLGGYIPDTANFPTSGYLILIGSNKTVIAHELFHAFQAAFKQNESSDRWFAEASAVWSEDFIYPQDNSEQKWLKVSPINQPGTSLDNTNLSGYEYGAYLFPFYLTQPGVSGSEIIGKIWAGCGNYNSCLNSIDKNISGDFEDTWREFTLWNYNKKPVKLYQDEGGFPEISSGVASYQSDIKKIGNNSIEISWKKDLEYLAAHLVEVRNKTNSPEVKQIIFKDFKNFTSQSNKAAIKAIVYPKNGEPYLDEEWTNKEERKFCLEDPRESFDNIVLIFSNGEMKKSLTATEITAEAKTESCYAIEQTDTREATYQITGSDSSNKANFTVKTTGTILEPAPAEAQYGYQAKWQAKLDYQEQWDPYSQVTGCVVHPGETKYTSTFEFDLSSVKNNSSFPVKVTESNVHYDPWSQKCTIAGFTTDTETEPVEYDDLSFSEGFIYDMSETEAKIKFPGSLAYGNFISRREMEPIVLEIKR